MHDLLALMCGMVFCASPCCFATFMRLVGVLV